MKFTAKLLDGSVLTEEDFPSVSALPLDQVIEVCIEGVTILVDLAKGERAHVFTRHTVPLGNPDIGKVSVGVLEIRKYDNTLCRLYCHPTKGLLLSSQDLYF